MSESQDPMAATPRELKTTLLHSEGMGKGQFMLLAGFSGLFVVMAVSGGAVATFIQDIITKLPV